MKKKTIIILIVLSVLLVFIIPILIDWLIIGNDFPSNISNSDWTSFLGGYVGALIGAIVSLVGIIITIRYTNKQNKLDRELQVKPYCSIRYSSEEYNSIENNTLANVTLSFAPASENFLLTNGTLFIKNIGLGPAVKFEIRANKTKCPRECSVLVPQKENDIVRFDIDTLKIGEEGTIPVSIQFNFPTLTPEEIEELKTPYPDIKAKYLEKYNNFIITISLSFFDILENKYYQEIALAIEIDVTENGYSGNISLFKTTPPQKYHNYLFS